MKSVLLIYGGVSTEHEVSCKSASTILNNYDKDNYIIDELYISKNNIWYLNNKKVKNIIETLKRYDVIFPMIHGKNGEDGRLQGLLELFNIKYIGSNLGTSYICMEKYISNILFKEYKIKHTKVYNNNIKYPVIVKPSKEGSSNGINIAFNKKELNESISSALYYDNNIVIEKYLDNIREIECAVIDNDGLNIFIGEIIHNKKIYDYSTKYNDETVKYIMEPKLDEKIKIKLYKYVKNIYEKFNIKNYARIDFFIKGNKIYINEINTIPGFTENSMFPMLLKYNNISIKEIISILIENA